MDTFNPDFREWPKTPRLFREIVITEKIDGTNAGLHISEDGQVVAQSRKRIITPDSDNYGFARWAADNADSLFQILGSGLYFGEWWGQGIQRRYGMVEKRFSLFNTSRWIGEETMSGDIDPVIQLRGGSISAVPTLYQGVFSEEQISTALQDLANDGSYAAPGFMDPEGICVYHSQTRGVFKVTLDANDAGKWEAAA